MQLRLLRNATMRLTYAGHEILTDPYLGSKHAYDSLAGKERNPTVDLPVTPGEAVAGAEMVIVSHLHNDHFDPAAVEILPKDIPLLCQPEDVERITGKGFTSVTPIEKELEWGGITITRTPGTHGTGTWAEQLNPVSGFVLRAPNEPTVYWCGDTIWYIGTVAAMAEHHPDIVITHSGGAELEDSGPIVMDAIQTTNVFRHAPNARVVAIHLESLDHCLTTRADVRAAAESKGLSSAQILIPVDGEILEFP